MKIKAYSKSILREIKSSKARFISILVIILLGVAFYSGIKASGPNMKAAIENFYNEYNLMDAKIVSSVGLSQEDLKLLDNNDKILDYYASHTIDANLTNINSVVKFMEYDQDKSVNINSLEILEGRLPKNIGEIALDEQALKYGDFKIGDTYTIQCDDNIENQLNNNSFKIVGIVRSPLYIEKLAKGTTTVGKGIVDYFAILNKNDFSMEVYSEIYITFKNTKDLETYSDEYAEKMKENMKYIEELFSSRPDERLEEIKIKAIEEIRKNYVDAIGSDFYISMIESQLPKIDDVKYYFFDRNDNPGYSEFYDVVKRINSIATVFPIVFFIVSVLICLTTMTRMVEENRIEIGTMKALGYSNSEISIKYILYASLASILGGILGVIIGFNLFPRIIYKAYSTQYDLPELTIVYYSSYIFQAMIISILCTVGAALIVLNVDLNSTPSILMRPKAPKIGKRILLERITLIWRRLNFNEKVTFRNLFRYKQRMIMTVFGIASCTAMIITGFGLKDSIGDLTNKQFNKLWKYQATVIFNENIDNENEDEYINKLNNIEGYEDSLKIHQEIVSISKENINKQNVTLYVPESNTKIDNFVLLNNRITKEKYQLTTDGAIINEKLAKLLEVKIGDEISFNNADNNSYKIKVKGISENYLTHAIYMSKEYYKNVFNNDVIYNSQFIKLSQDNYNEDDIASQLMESNKVINVTMTSYLAKTTNESMDTLNVVVIILIISAGGLALVVLYNLNNINVSERIRELSTIKVLGFYDYEVTMYILRENFILTALGIIIGVFMGKILHGFVITTAEADNMMLSPNIYIMSFIYSVILTIVFSLIVMFMMHRKLRKINMIDALKSNE